MKIVATLLLLFPLIGNAQQLPYETLSPYPNDFSAGKVAARTIDGLGFRFYWATDGLRENDLSYKPSADARTSLETIAHIYEMSFLVVNAALKKENVGGQDINLPFAEMRKKTLENLKTASDALKNLSDEQMKDCKIMFTLDGKKQEYPFWNLINGPLEDCIWHVGQIVSFRRASGNPFSDKIDLFSGAGPK